MNPIVQDRSSRFTNSAGTIAKIRDIEVYRGMLVSMFGQTYTVDYCKPVGIGFRVVARNAEGVEFEFKTKELIPVEDGRVSAPEGIADEKSGTTTYGTVADWKLACEAAGLFLMGVGSEIHAVNGASQVVGAFNETTGVNYIRTECLKSATPAPVTPTPDKPRHRRINVWFGAKDLKEIQRAVNRVFSVKADHLNTYDDCQRIFTFPDFELAYDPEEGVVVYARGGIHENDVYVNAHVYDRMVAVMEESPWVARVHRSSEVDVKVDLRSKATNAMPVAPKADKKPEAVKAKAPKAGSIAIRPRRVKPVLDPETVATGKIPCNVKRAGYKDRGDAVAVYLRGAENVDQLTDLVGSLIPCYSVILSNYQAKFTSFGLIKMNFTNRLRALVKNGAVTLPA